MANVREQLQKGQVEVNHQNQSAMFWLPDWMQSVADCLDDPNRLQSVLQSEGVLLGVLHKGLAQCLIDVRAKARPNATKSNPDPVLDTAEQRRKAKEYKPDTLPLPNNEEAQAVKLIEKLKKAGYTKAQILEMIGD